MKKYIIFILVVLISLMQVSDANAQNDGIGIHFGAYDFYGKQSCNYFFVQRDRINYKSDNTKNDTTTRYALLWNTLVGASYWHRFDRHWDIKLGMTLSNLIYPNSSNDKSYQNYLLYGVGNKTKVLLVEVDGNAHYNFLSRAKHTASPYALAGLSFSAHDRYVGAELPVGGGVNVRLIQSIFFNAEIAYKLALFDNDQNHIQYSAGIVYFVQPWKKIVKKTKEQIAQELDTDHDGIPDIYDHCPLVKGPARFHGCPDTDGDGIPDDEDECPTQAGLPDFNGCPDTDGDGIPDKRDRCPFEAGPADNGGCPVGNLDIRPDVIERVDNAAKAIYFETAKATLKPESFKQLNIIANILNEDENLFADIEGYTDNVGQDMKNLKLSEERANACRNYLIEKGISADRLTARGYGPVLPVADNKTPAGRAQNRRTEVKLRTTKRK
ncbi:MAG: OmpA family protein [Bacteroidota bacterium]